MRCVVFLLCVVVGQVARAQSSSESDRLVRGWKGIEDFQRSMWIGKPALEIPQQVKPKDEASLAVQACWKRTIDKLSRQAGTQAESIDQSQLSYFLGFLEGRANIEAPLWWSKSVLSSKVTKDLSLYSDDLDGPATFNPIDRLRSMKDIHASKHGERYEFEFNGKTFTLPPEMLHLSSAGLADDMDCVVDGKFMYVSVGDSMWSGIHRVCCIDTEKKTTIWQSETCEGFHGVFGGVSVGYDEMRMFPSNRLFVFNASHVGFFIHGFDASDGKTIFEFSSDFDR